MEINYQFFYKNNINSIKVSTYILYRMIKIRTDNIYCVHNHDLIDKLRCASHPSINDVEAVKLVKEEIKKRQLDVKWDLISEEEEDDEILLDEKDEKIENGYNCTVYLKRGPCRVSHSKCKEKKL